MRTTHKAEADHRRSDLCPSRLGTGTDAPVPKARTAVLAVRSPDEIQVSFASICFAWSLAPRGPVQDLLPLTAGTPSESRFPPARSGRPKPLRLCLPSPYERSHYNLSVVFTAERPSCAHLSRRNGMKFYFHVDGAYSLNELPDSFP